MLPYTMNRIATFILPVVVLTLAACGDGPPVVSKSAVEKSLHDLESGMVKALAAKDAALFAANYTTDAILMSATNPPMKGREAIKAGIGMALTDPNFKLEFAADQTEVSASGDMALTRGTYTLTATNPATNKPLHDKGSYVTAYRKQADGAWKAILDINTSEVAPPAPPAPKAVANRAAGKKSGKH